MTRTEWKYKKNREKRYYRKQKALGFAFTIIGIVAPFALDGDITFSVLSIPVGLYIMFTNEKIMNFDED